MHSAHTQFPAICTKSDCASARPHWEHHNSDWTGVSWLIWVVLSSLKRRTNVAQTVPRAKYFYLEQLVALKQRLSTLRTRMDKIYDDKLEGKIDESFGLCKQSEYIESKSVRWKRRFRAWAAQCRKRMC